ncbi:hypothetical protein BDP27DRAFT_1450305 [Rhodocollybia butyracea]|uniref:Uncharacterized protein n=1 Tax=Rhodocollybia butyracea TaxID=206335 RepID=A0A9P5PK12_9AGAR|nr:hypothetical protein BDP27DRAFT_1450305 [Rhodocollybia butyracea]
MEHENQRKLVCYRLSLSTKYSSHVAELYKEELVKRVREDTAKFPQGIIVKLFTPKTSAPSTPWISSPIIATSSTAVRPIASTSGATCLNSAGSTGSAGFGGKDQNLATIVNGRKWRKEAEEKARKETEVKMAALEIGNKVTAIASSLKKADTLKQFAYNYLGNQKASDMYFGWNSYDPQAVTEAPAQLRSFRGASAIFSNQYFGQDKEDELAMSRNSDFLLGDENLAGLELAPQDVISRVMDNPNVQNVRDNTRARALKRDFLISAFFLARSMSTKPQPRIQDPPGISCGHLSI